MTKYAFCFTLKALFALKILFIFLWLFCHVEEQLGQKDNFNFKIYDVATWGTNNCNTRIVQYLKKKRQLNNEIWPVNKQNITWGTFFYEKSFTNYGGETIPWPFRKSQIWVYFWINSASLSNLCTVCFYCMPSPRLSKYFETKLVPLPQFLHDFWRKMFLFLYSVDWPNFIVPLSLLREILGNFCIAIAY